MKFSKERVFASAVSPLRSLAETTPTVTVLSKVRGSPIAITHSPTRSRSESPSGIGVRRRFASIFNSARSVEVSRPTIFAGKRSFPMRTSTLSAFSTTWLFVTMKPSSEMMNPDPPWTSLCSSSSPPRCWLRRGPKKNSKGSPSPPWPNGLPRRLAPLTMSVEVMETTEGIASSAMSAKDGTITPVVRTRAGVTRWASERGVTLTETATTMPKTTAAAISTEKDKARLVDFCIRVVSPDSRAIGRVLIRNRLTDFGIPPFDREPNRPVSVSRFRRSPPGSGPPEPLPLDQDAAIHRDGNARGLEPQRGFLVEDPLLHEEETRPARDRLVRDRCDVLRPAEHVHDVQPNAGRDLGERWIAGPAQKLAVARVDRDDAVPAVDQVAGDRIGRALRVRRAADHRDRARRLESRANLLGVIHRGPPRPLPVGTSPPERGYAVSSRGVTGVSGESSRPPSRLMSRFRTFRPSPASCCRRRSRSRPLSAFREPPSRGPSEEAGRGWTSGSPAWPRSRRAGFPIRRRASRRRRCHPPGCRSES